LASVQGQSDVELSVYMREPVFVTALTTHAAVTITFGKRFLRIRPAGFRGFTGPPGEERYGASVRPFRLPFKSSAVQYSANLTSIRSALFDVLTAP
jgi:hypothetical protein